jgi:hypothetical protein
MRELATREQLWQVFRTFYSKSYFSDIINYALKISSFQMTYINKYENFPYYYNKPDHLEIIIETRIVPRQLILETKHLKPLNKFSC